MPKYEGVTGYIVGNPSDIEKAPPKRPWFASEYVQTGPDKWAPNPKKRLEHKLPVRVVAQHLKHEGWGFYSGTLFVETMTSPARQALIDHHSFTPAPYWACGLAAARDHYVLAHIDADGVQGVDSDGNWIATKRGMPVLCGDVHAQRRGSVSLERDEVGCLVYRKWRISYGGAPVIFKPSTIAVDY